MIVLHCITLPNEQALWWRDFARDLGLRAEIIGSLGFPHLKVSASGPQSDIQAAWELFFEQFVRLTQ